MLLTCRQEIFYVKLKRKLGPVCFCFYLLKESGVWQLNSRLSQKRGEKSKVLAQGCRTRFSSLSGLPSSLWFCSKSTTPEANLRGQLCISFSSHWSCHELSKQIKIIFHLLWFCCHHGWRGWTRQPTFHITTFLIFESLFFAVKTADQ